MKVIFSLRFLSLVVAVAICFAPESRAASGGGFSDSAYATHIQNLKNILPNRGFTIVLEKPFEVIGYMPAAQLRTRWAQGTVRWATKKLKASYFTNDPVHILDV